MHKSKFKSGKRTNLKAILLGLCLSMILHAILSLPGAIVLNAMKNPTAATGIVGIIIHVASGILTSFAVCRYKGQTAVFTCLVFSLSFFVLALAVGVIAGDGGITLESVINSLIYVLECTLFAVIFKRLKEKKR